MADDTTTAAAASSLAEEQEAAPKETLPDDDDGDEQEQEEDEDEGGEDESGAGVGGSGGSTKKKRKKRKKKNAAASSSIAVPAAFQGNIRVGPAPPPPSKKKGSSGSGVPPLGPSEAPVGRAGLAARALEEGELVFEEAPVALVIFQAQAKPRCGYCGRDRPPGCGGRGDGVVPVPCSTACGASRLAAAYRLAKGALALVEDVAKESDCEAQLLTLVLLLACLKHLAKSEEDKGEEGTAAWCAGWDGVAALEDHRGRMAPEFVAAVEGALSKLWPHLPADVRATVGPAEGEGVRLACVVNVNSHGCTAPETTNSTIGVGLFPLLAMLNHSCAPNCAFVFLEGAVRVRALRPIAAGEELTVTYLNLLLPRRDRRQILLETKHFLCRCPRCLQPPPSDALLGGVCCAKCGERGLLLAPGEDDADVATGLEELTVKEGKEKGEGGDEWRCSLCGAAFAVREVLGYLDTVEASKLQGQIMYQGKAFPQAKAHFDAALALHAATPTGGASASSSTSSSAGVKRVTTNSKLRVHPSNHLLVEMLPFLVNACNQLKDYGAASAHLRRMLAVLSEALPSNYPELGDYHHALGVAIYHHLQPRMATGGALPRKTLQELRASFEMALKVRRTALGAGHPLTRESREMVEATTTG